MDMSFYPWFHNAIHRLLLQLTFQWNYWDAVRHFYAVKPIDVTSDSYAEYNENINKKDPKFKAGDHARISK